MTSFIEPHLVSAFRREETLVSRMASAQADPKQLKSVQGVEDSWKSMGTQLYLTPGGYSYSELRDVILGNDVLFTGIMVRAGMATDQGYFLERSDGVRERLARKKNKAVLQKWLDGLATWRAGGGLGGVCTVLQQMYVDRLMFGSGFLELLPPTNKIPGMRIAGVSHLSRLLVRLLRPEKQTVMKGVGSARKSITFYDPLDLLYPRLAYSPAGIGSSGASYGDLRYLKAFGDDRRINSYTGKVDPSCAWDDEATEFIRMRNYVPGYEEGCPEWWSALQHVDTMDALSEYFRHVLRNNAIPDLMVILKGATVQEKQVRQFENKFKQVRQRRSELGNYVNVIVWGVYDDSTESADEEPPVTDVDVHELNPIDGNTIRAMLDLHQRESLRVGMVLRMPSQLMNYERNTGLGSGAEITAAMHMVTKLVIGADQGRIHAILDRVIGDGYGISDYRARLEQPAYNDPETEARIARLWSMVRGLTVNEWRDKIGLSNLNDALEPSKENEIDVGKVMMMPLSDVVLTYNSMKEIITAVHGSAEQEALPEGTLKSRLRLLLDDCFSGRNTRAALDDMMDEIRTTIEEEITLRGFTPKKEQKDDDEDEEASD